MTDSFRGARPQLHDSSVRNPRQTQPRLLRIKPRSVKLVQIEMNALPYPILGTACGA